MIISVYEKIVVLTSYGVGGRCLRLDDDVDGSVRFGRRSLTVRRRGRLPEGRQRNRSHQLRIRRVQAVQRIRRVHHRLGEARVLQAEREEVATEGWVRER